MKKIIMPSVDELDKLKLRMTRPELATHYGVSETTIGRWVAKLEISGGGGRTVSAPAGLYDAPISGDLSWAIGFLIADGCLHKTKSGHYTLSAGQVSRDVDILCKLMKIFGGGSMNYYSDTDQYRWIIGVSDYADRLMELGIVPRKSSIIKFPSAGLVSYPDYIRGLWDGDGCWHVRKGKYNYLSASYTSVSEDFVDSLLNHLRPIVRSFNDISTHRCAGTKVGNISRNHNTHVIAFTARTAVDLAHYLYNDATLSGNRKKSIAAPFLL